jgi:integrase
MARPPSVWLRSQDNHYYTTIKGEKIKLSPELKEATRLFHELLAMHEEPAGCNISPTFKKVADLFLDESEKNKKPTTYRMAKMFLQSLVDRIGKKRVTDLKVFDITAWVNAHDWNESTACSARATVLAALNWAVNQGFIDSHPLTKLKRGTHKRRERIFTSEELASIRGKVKPDFADFLHALELSGARPFSELATITADGINWKTKTITFDDHKNVAKGKTRTIYLSAPLEELLRRKCQERPKGFLFVNRNGGAWTSHDATRRLHWATDQLKMPRGTIYAVRHHYCTSALSKGMSANLLAELVGNSPVTLSRHYDHLSMKRDVMLEAAAKAVA